MPIYNFRKKVDVQGGRAVKVKQINSKQRVKAGD